MFVKRCKNRQYNSSNDSSGTLAVCFCQTENFNDEIRLQSITPVSFVVHYLKISLFEFKTHSQLRESKYKFIRTHRWRQMRKHSSKMYTIHVNCSLLFSLRSLPSSAYLRSPSDVSKMEQNNNLEVEFVRCQLRIHVALLMIQVLPFLLHTLVIAICRFHICCTLHSTHLYF